MIVHIQDMGSREDSGRYKSVCGKYARDLWPDKMYDPDRNLKTLINSVVGAGKTCELCVYCSKWGDLVYLADTEL